MPFQRPEKYSCLVIDHDMDVRVRLREAMNAMRQFGDKRQVNYFSEALRELDQCEEVHLVFISYRFGHDEIIKFIEAARKVPQAMDAAFILLLERDKEEDLRLASKIILGADGLLFEPYSVEDLVKATEIADQVKRLHISEREVESLRYVIKGIIKYLDLLANLKASDMPTSRVENKFREVCRIIHDFQPESVEEYFRQAIEYFDRVPLPGVDTQGRPFVSVSKRIRRRMEKIMLDDVTNDLKDSEQ